MTGKQNVKALQILVDAVRQAALGDAALTIEPSLLPDGYADVVEAINTLFVRVNETARQHTLLQRSLEQEKAKHERLQANIPGVVYLYQIDLDGSCTFPYVSTSSREHFHLEPEEIMRDGSLLLKLRHPDDVERMEAAIRESAKTLQPFRFEVRHIVDGNVRWHECLSRPTRLPDGTILWDGIMLDISERKKAEETVRRGEFQYRRLYESLTDAFAIVDMDGRIQAVNAAFQNMVGYGEEEIYQFAYPDITPEAWHRREEEIVATQVLKRGYSDVYEKEYRRKDGTVFPVELRTFLLRDEAGRPSGMWAIARDITERKLAEHALHITQYCIEHASIGIYQVDEPDGRIVNANNWACQSMGYTRDELCRLTVFDIDPTFDLA